MCPNSRLPKRNSSPPYRCGRISTSCQPCITEMIRCCAPRTAIALRSHAFILALYEQGEPAFGIRVFNGGFPSAARSRKTNIRRIQPHAAETIPQAHHRCSIHPLSCELVSLRDLDRVSSFARPKDSRHLASCISAGCAEFCQRLVTCMAVFQPHRACLLRDLGDLGWAHDLLSIRGCLLLDCPRLGAADESANSPK